mmetsp:Transcript_10460/g.14779  ORF Transcript_10460/g.14779 Transcript_10460/m.14779 type:complete len:311 (+) Transcript_10460:28-960(+)
MKLPTYSNLSFLPLLSLYALLFPSISQAFLSNGSISFQNHLYFIENPQHFSFGLRSAVKSTTTPITNEADKLLQLLLLPPIEQDKNRDQVQELVAYLISQKVEVDPYTCLNGPLYAVRYLGGPVPFWEQKNNFKGQRYTIPMKTDRHFENEIDEGIEETICYDVTNYAEFFGEVLSLQASATCRKNKDVNDDIKTDTDTSENNNGIMDNIFNSLSSIPFSLNPKDKENNLLRCPVDYTISVRDAQINLIGKMVLKFNINRTGYLRILYADNNLRILTAPKDTTNSNIQEKAGLIVVQVCVDLIRPSFHLQ